MPCPVQPIQSSFCCLLCRLSHNQTKPNQKKRKEKLNQNYTHNYNTTTTTNQNPHSSNIGATVLPASTKMSSSIRLSTSGPCSTRFQVVMRASFMSKSKMRILR